MLLRLSKVKRKRHILTAEKKNTLYKTAKALKGTLGAIAKGKAGLIRC